MTTKQLLTETFTTKDGYLAWREGWRAAYAQLSHDIRVSKLLLKDNARNPVTSWVDAKDGKPGYWQRSRPWTPEEAKRQAEAAEVNARVLACHQNHSCTPSALASLLMVRRAWSKEEAQRQYQAEHPVAV